MDTHTTVPRRFRVTTCQEQLNCATTPCTLPHNIRQHDLGRYLMLCGRHCHTPGCSAHESHCRILGIDETFQQNVLRA